MYLFLLPPSEGKNTGGSPASSSRTFNFNIPSKIASSSSPKELKCTGKRYDEAIKLNKKITIGNVLPAMERYSGVMYHAIEYPNFSGEAQNYFDTHVLILSALRGFLTPQDTIPNYKLPVTTKLRHYWKNTLTDELINYTKKQGYTHIIDLLSGSYQKLLNFDALTDSGVYVVEVDFLHEKKGELKKMTHGVKGVKGRWLHNIIENKKFDIDAWNGGFEEGVFIKIKST